MSEKVKETNVKDEKVLAYQYTVSRFTDGSVSLDAVEVEGQKISEYEMYEDLRDVTRLTNDRLDQAKITSTVIEVLRHLQAEEELDNQEEEK